MERYAGKNMYATNLLGDAVTALSLGSGWPDEAPHKQELAMLQVSKNLHFATTLSAGSSHVTGRQISSTNFEKEELTLRPQRGKEATSVKRDHSRP